MTSPTLGEALDRAQREGWSRLAVCGVRWRVPPLLYQGWAEPYLLVPEEPIGDPGDLIARLAKIKSLRELVVAGLGVGDKGARAIAERLTSLTSLDLGYNNIGDAGARVIAERLASLTSLNIEANNIEEAGAQAIAEGLTSLTSLDLGHNDLHALPQSLRGLSRLSYLRVAGNPRLNLPPEIAGDTDPKVILAWYFNEKKRRLNEAKVLMVGQGGVGKTSLVRAVIRGLEADPSEGMTKIHIDTWTIESRHEGEKLRVNVWDFGGQEIMHATHQFFLTKRSVYVLVIDARAGEIEGNIHYWLQTIRSFGGDSPVMVVTNKIDATSPGLNENGLVRQYAPMQMTFHRVSCKTLQGIDDFKNALQRAIRGLAHVDDELPDTYFDVKAALEKTALERQYVDKAHYIALCKERRVEDPSQQDRLLRFLHDLGTVLNFDDAESPYQLGDTNILDPKWVTEAVYAIINDPRLRDAQGVLERKKLPEILEDRKRYPSDKQRRFIVDIMRKFELCFDFPDQPDKLLVPELLSRNEPDVNWKDAKDCLAFEYAYTVLPSGLLPRFIVRMHHALTAHPTYWRSGVVLSIDGCKVLVRGDGRFNAVRISVDGPRETRRSALAAVRLEFNAIHATMPGLEVNEQVPLPDAPTVRVPYADLLKYEKLSRTQPAADMFLPQGLPPDDVRMYSARALLSGVDASSAHEAPAAAPIAPAMPEPSPEPAEAPAEHKHPERPADGKVLAGITRIYLVVLAGVVGAIVLELYLIPDFARGALAVGATVILTVIGFVYLGRFSAKLSERASVRLLEGAMDKGTSLGRDANDEAKEAPAPAEPTRRKPAPKEPKALPPAKLTRAPEATEPDGAGGGAALAGEPERRPRAAKRKPGG